MSKIEVHLVDNILTINKVNTRGNNNEEIDIDMLKYNLEYDSNIKPSKYEEKNKVFLICKLNNQKNEIENLRTENSNIKINSSEKLINLFKYYQNEDVVSYVIEF